MAALDSILGPVLRAGLTWLGRRRLPKIDGDLSLPGLTAPVEIIRDKWGIPHIYAKNEPDLYRTVGYVMAQDRLWQMDLMRRITTGRLSEVLDPGLVDADQLFRALQFSKNQSSLCRKPIRSYLPVWRRLAMG